MFKVRSKEKELLDSEYIPEADLFQNLKELDFINDWLGGYGVSFDALNKILDYKNTMTLVDIGSGGGDTLRNIHDWAQRKGLPLHLVGVDLKPECVEYANARKEGRSIAFICDDYKNVNRYTSQIDILHASLFCHHLSDSELVALIQYALLRKSVLIINDLERNPVAYYSIAWLTRLFSKSYLVKNDAPLSVLRGFKKKEWEQLLRKAGATRFTIRNKWAFRHQIIVYGV